MGQEASSLVDDSVPPKTLTERSLSAVAEYIKDGTAERIVVLTGAGISTAAGIPDFRSPGTGLYANLSRLNLPHAEAVFDISYFRENPDPFYVLARELYPGKFHPTVSHAFIALLAHKGLLRQLFTQNIDCLERRAGVPADKIVEAHGSFATQRCIDCKTEFPDDVMLEHVNRGDVPRCQDKTCRGLVKPDIVFFGEQLPKEFSRQSYQLGIADLVIVIGTSLTVHPFAALPEMAPDDKPRVLFNLDRVGQMGTRADDVLELGDCDAGIRKLADELGWREELEELWKKVVGEKEAKWQKASRKKHEDEVEEEVTKLAEDVEAALKIEDTPDQDSKANETGEKADTNQPESKEGTSATEPIEPRPEEVKADAESKDQAPNEVAAAEAKPAEDGKDKDIKDGRDTEKSVL